MRPTEWSATMDTKSRPLADSIDSSCWTIQTASFIVVDDRRANIQGRNLLRKSEYNYTRREKQTGKSALHVNNIDSSDTQIAAWVHK